MKLPILWAFSLAVSLTAGGCATMRDTIEAREAGTSRVLAASFDATWAAAVEVMQPYPTAELDKARGVLVTQWAERLVDPSAFGEYQFLMERTRWTIAVSERDGGSRVRLRHEAQFFSPVYVDPASSTWGAAYFAPWRGMSMGADSSTTVSVLPNPWDKMRGAPLYVWRDESQTDGISAPPARERENQLLAAIEAGVNAALEQGRSAGIAARDPAN